MYISDISENIPHLLLPIKYAKTSETPLKEKQSCHCVKITQNKWSPKLPSSLGGRELQWVHALQSERHGQPQINQRLPQHKHPQNATLYGIFKWHVDLNKLMVDVGKYSTHIGASGIYDFASTRNAQPQSTKAEVMEVDGSKMIVWISTRIKTNPKLTFFSS